MNTRTAKLPTPDQRVEELGRIILAYSEVTDKLQQSHDQLQQTVELLREELSEKNRQLERRNRLAALGEMAAGLAHEIRNPLGGINLYASLLARDVADIPEALTTCNKINAGVKRLDALVSQTLQFTREISANVVDMDLAVIVEQTVDLARPTIDAKQIAIELQLREKTIKHQMTRIFSKLAVSNRTEAAMVFRDAFRELRTPSEGLRKAFDHLEAHFGRA